MAVNKIVEKNRLVVVVTNEVTGKEKKRIFPSPLSMQQRKMQPCWPVAVPLPACRPSRSPAFR